MATPVILIGTRTATNLSLAQADANKITGVAIKKLDSASNEYPHGNNIKINGNTYLITSVALASDGSACLGGICNDYNPANINTAWALSDAQTTFFVCPNGIIRWTANHGALVSAVAIDDNHNVYTLGNAVKNNYEEFPDVGYGGVGGPSHDRIGYVNLRKYNNLGALQWSVDTGFLYKLDYSLFEYGHQFSLLYDNGYLYISGNTLNHSTTTWGAVTKVNASTGAMVWRALQPPGGSSFPFHAIKTVKYGGYLYSVGSFRTSTYHHVIEKINDSDGSVIASASTFNDYLGNPLFFPISLAITNDGATLYLLTPKMAVNSGSNDYAYLHRYNSSLVYQQAYYPTDLSEIWPRDITCDLDDSLYLLQSRRNTATITLQTIIKYDDPANAMTWGESLFTGTDNLQPFAFSVRNIETPPLLIPLNLGIPTIIGDLSTHVPALRIPLNFAIPFTVRDYVGPPLPTIYRVYVAGLEVAFKNFSYRASSAGNLLTVTVPSATPELITEIDAHRGETISIYRGIRFHDGTEQLDLFLSSVLTTMSYSAGANSASVILSGAMTTISMQLKTRTLRGISYRRNYNGKRTVRADIDTYLNIGDTVNLGGGETMIVASITIFVSPESGFMEVSE